MSAKHELRSCFCSSRSKFRVSGLGPSWLFRALWLAGVPQVSAASAVLTYLHVMSLRHKKVGSLSEAKNPEPRP